MVIELKRYPTKDDMQWMKECTLGTVGKDAKTPPSSDFVRRMLVARHSPIRELTFSYVIRDVPYWVSVHLVRHHVGFQPYVQSQRNDRQSAYDRTKAPQDTPVTMRVTLNAEALLTLANKRLCMKASPETRDVVQRMCALAEKVVPELHGLLVPMCEYHGGMCYEIDSCGRAKRTKQATNAEIEGGGTSWYYVCGECHGQIDKDDMFCRHCGGAVSWC